MTHEQCLSVLILDAVSSCFREMAEMEKKNTVNNLSDTKQPVSELQTTLKDIFINVVKSNTRIYIKNKTKVRYKLTIRLV